MWVGIAEKVLKISD